MSKPIEGARPHEWAKHLRKWGKRAFWKRLRAKQRDQAKEIKRDA